MQYLSMDARHIITELTEYMRLLAKDVQRRVPANQNPGKSGIESINRYAEVRETLGYLAAIGDLSDFIGKLLEKYDG